MIVSHFEADPHDVRKDSQKAEILEPFRLYERGETAAFSEPPSWYPFFFQLRSDELRLALEKRWYGYTFSFCEPIPSRRFLHLRLASRQRAREASPGFLR